MKVKHKRFSGEFLVRATPALHARLKKLALEHNRRFNGEVVEALERYVLAELGQTEKGS